MENAQTEIEELVRVHLFYFGLSLILPTETRARRGAGSARDLERGEIRAA